MTATVTMSAGAPRPLSWMERVQRLAGRRPWLAPLLGGDAPIIGGRRTLYPWWPGRDVAALLGWAEELQEHPLAATIAPAPGGVAWSVVVTGELLGEVVDLVAVTIREIPAGVVAWDVMHELAAEEIAALAPVLVDVQLPDGDPLGGER